MNSKYLYFCIDRRFQDIFIPFVLSYFVYYTLIKYLSFVKINVMIEMNSNDKNIFHKQLIKMFISNNLIYLSILWYLSIHILIYIFNYLYN